MTFELELLQKLVVALEKVPGVATFATRTRFLQGVYVNVTRDENSRRGDLFGILSDLDAADPASTLRVIDNALFAAGDGDAVTELQRLREQVQRVLADRNGVSRSIVGTLAAPLEKYVSELKIKDLGAWITGLQTRQGQVACVTVQNVPRGTGFLVGPDVALTNHHVLEDVLRGDRSPDDVRFQFDYSRDAEGKVRATTNVRLAKDWRLAAAPPSTADYRADIHVLPAEGELDFALVRLERRIGDEPREGAARRWIEVPKTPRLPEAGMQLFVLQHPMGVPLQIALDAVTEVNANKTRARYRTNTNGGSSGSPCLDQDWNVLALHHSGDPEAPSGQKARYNQGIPIATIRAWLEAQGKGGLLG